jgi:hypothetical protein
MININFLKKSVAKSIIVNCDTYLDMMSPCDYAMRMGVACNPNHIIDRDEFARYITQHVLDWTDSEKKDVTDTITDVVVFLQKIKFKGQFPESIYIIKTDGTEDLRDFAGYCRKNTICISTYGISSLSHRFFIYALFVIYLQNNISIKNELYNSIGFHRCNEIELPKYLKPKTMIHPDAYFRDTYINVTVDDDNTKSHSKRQKIRCTPILLLDNNNKGTFFTKTCVKFLRVCTVESGMSVPYLFQDDTSTGKKCLLYDVTDLYDLFDQIGECSHYFHPDEIIATRFSKMVFAAMWYPDRWHQYDNPHERSMKELLFNMSTDDNESNDSSGIKSCRCIN